MFEVDGKFLFFLLYHQSYYIVPVLRNWFIPEIYLIFLIILGLNTLTMHYLETTIDYLDKNVIQLTITFILIFLFLIARSVVRKVVRRQAKKADLAYPRELYVKKLTITILFIFFTTIIGMIWGISLRGLSVYFASIFTVIGIGLFATWSILSNLTASVVLYFFFPYRIGDTIKIVDGDNSVEGEIVDITLFNIRIKAENELLYSYPNNLAIQKPISSKNHDF